MSRQFGVRAIFALPIVSISRVRTLTRPRNRGHSMRTAITLLEWSIGAALTIAVVAYMAHGALLMVTTLL